MHEDGYRQVYENGSTPTLNMQTRDKIDTFIIGSKVTLIPKNYVLIRTTHSAGKLDVDLGLHGVRLLEYPTAGIPGCSQHHEPSRRSA